MMSLGYKSSFMGVQVITSPHALKTEHCKAPISDDMVAMIDDLTAAGHPPLTREVPAMFTMGGKHVVHPELMRQLQERMIRQSDQMADDLIRKGFTNVI